VDQKECGDPPNQTNILFWEKLKTFRIIRLAKVVLELFTSSALQASKFCSTVSLGDCGWMSSQAFLLLLCENGTRLAISVTETNL
jgi:hypothetical protein